jgi:hypothetical protein
LTAEGTTSKGRGSINCEVEFCIFYKLSLRTLRTKNVHECERKSFLDFLSHHKIIYTC